MKSTGQGRISLGYVRVSTDMQAETGRSLADQTRRLKSYVQDRLGLTLLDEQIYTDAGESGTLSVRQLSAGKGRVRPNLSDLVDRCMEGGVEALVIDTIDRLARDIFVCFGIQRMIEPHGTRVLVADGDLDFSDPDDEMLVGVRALIGQAEWKKMSQRARRTQVERRTAGYPPWGKAPFGWRWMSNEEFHASGEPFKGIARVDEQAEWVRWIFDQYLRRGRVILDICAELNGREVPYGDSDIDWQGMRIRKVLDTFIHAGLIEDNEGQLRRGAHFDQRIIDPDVWHATQDLRAERSTRGPRALSQRDAPLLGIARCGACDRRLQLHRGRGEKVYYVCPKPQEGEERHCPGLTKRSDIVEKVVADFIRQIAAAPRLRSMIEREAAEQLAEHQGDLRNRRDELEAKRADLDGGLEELARRLTDGTISPEAFANVDQSWRKDREAADIELGRIERGLEMGDAECRRLQRVMDALDAFTETWQHLPAPQIRQLLLSMVEELTVEPQEGGAVTVRFRCYYMPEMTQHLPHLRGKVGGEDDRIADLTMTDLAFLALWAEGKAITEIDKARGIKRGSSYSRAHLIRQRSGLQDLDEVAQLAAARIEQYRHLLPVDCKCAEVERQPDREPTRRQLEVARLMAEGLSSKEIARRLGPLPSTIRRHMSNLRKKLGVESSEEALMLLAGQGEVDC